MAREKHKTKEGDQAHCQEGVRASVNVAEVRVEGRVGQRVCGDWNGVGVELQRLPSQPGG